MWLFQCLPKTSQSRLAVRFTFLERDLKPETECKSNSGSFGRQGYKWWRKNKFPHTWVWNVQKLDKSIFRFKLSEIPNMLKVGWAPSLPERTFVLFTKLKAFLQNLNSKVFNWKSCLKTVKIQFSFPLQIYGNFTCVKFFPLLGTNLWL